MIKKKISLINNSFYKRKPLINNSNKEKQLNPQEIAASIA